MQRVTAVLVGLALITAGCIGTAPTDSEELDENAPDAPEDVAGQDVVRLDPEVEQPELDFTTQVVDAAVGYTSDLYEPTMEVSDNGVIYVTGHTILVDTTGAPVFMSHDDGDSWEQLPFFESAQMPAGIHGATPPPSDEIFLTAGEDGWLYGVDITAATFPVNAWENDGERHAYHNPNAYDRADATTSGECGAVSLNDRPWGEAQNGKLLMVSNPGTGAVQIGAMDVAPDDQVDEPGNPATGPQWNMCAGETTYIPGIPDMREDHFFAVPYQAGEQLKLATGNANNVNSIDTKTAFNFTTTGGGTSNYGQVVFDDEGTMFVGIRNNTEENADGERTGQLKLAASTDEGDTFETLILQPGAPTTSIYMDGNMHGSGALLTWAQEGDDGTDWYAAHLSIDDEGNPVVENVSLALDEGPPPSAHVQGAALGPDGSAHMIMYYGGYSAADRANPLEVLVRDGGPTVPIDVPVDEVD
jgi:hypothetical protein